MKKSLAIRFAVVMMLTASTASFLFVSTVSAASNNVEMAGAGDGHCTKCGLRNGHYRCPAFYPASGSQPTTCGCGHSKNSHVYRR